ncbi:MAG: acyltransferase family protein [Prevotella sp.]|nr:acyltransferase family protein [Prevotella sp.]
MQQRINYIDRLKGLAILLVVMGHVYVIALDLTDEVVYRVIGNFRMSLFMYLSGLVACSGIVVPYWDWSKTIAFVRIAGHRAFVCK